MARAEREASFDAAGSAGKRLTATETVGSVVCRITLEQDDSGCYREIDLTPIGALGDRGGRAR